MVESLDLKDIGLTLNADGFGPVAGLQPWSDEFDGKLYQPYNKKEKIGKVCDFVSAAFLNVPVKPQQKAAPTATQEILDEEDQGFEVIEDTANLAKKRVKTGQYQQNTYYTGRGRGGAGFTRGGARPSGGA